MRVLVDMNLSPAWVQTLERSGWPAIHWSAIGDPRAPDTAIMEWARSEGYVVFTNDLDFGAILAATEGRGPSVIQIRARDVSPQGLEHVVVAALRQHGPILKAGAVVAIDEHSARARILPLRR